MLTLEPGDLPGALKPQGGVSLVRSFRLLPDGVLMSFASGRASSFSDFAVVSTEGDLPNRRSFLLCPCLGRQFDMAEKSGPPVKGKNSIFF